MDRFKIFITGGTIDKTFNSKTGQLEIVETSVYQILRDANVKPATCMNAMTLMLLNNNELTQEHSKFILSNIINHNGPVIITCDLHKILELADYITDNRPSHWQQCAFLTGARVPFSQPNSDAAFNLGCAVTAARLYSSDCGSVQIVLNGLVKSSRYIDRSFVHLI